MADHLGYDRHDRAGHGSGNSRNGWTGKTLRTDVGDVRIAVPRDRAGTFLPAVVPKHSRRLTGFDEAVVSLYAKGITTGTLPITWPTSMAERCPGSWSARSPTP